MNIFKNKRFIATTLVFVLVMALAGLPLPAKERRGSTVVVTMTDGSKIKGELLAVKTDALLVYDSAAHQGKSIDLLQVAKVKVLKKSKALLGFAIGLAIGLGILISNSSTWETTRKDEAYQDFAMTPIIGLIGGVFGVLIGVPEKFYLSGESSQNVLQNLGQLKSYARER